MSYDMITVPEIASSGLLQPIPMTNVSRGLVDPKMIHYTDGHLVVIDNTDQAFIKLFHDQKETGDFSMVLEFGIRGEGPGEFSIAPFIIGDKPKNKPSIGLLDWARNTYYNVDLQKFISSGEWHPDQTVTLPPELMRAQRVTAIQPDSVVIGIGGLQYGKLFAYNLQQQEVTRYTDFIPQVKESVPDPGMFYIGEFVVNKKRGRVAAASSRFRQIELYDFDLNLLSITTLGDIVSSPSLLRRVFGQTSAADIRIHFYDLDYSDDHIFVLNDNRSLMELGSGQCSDESQLLQFDWHGNLLQWYELEGCPVRITFDPTQNRMIALFQIVDEQDLDRFVQYYSL